MGQGTWLQAGGSACGKQEGLNTEHFKNWKKAMMADPKHERECSEIRPQKRPQPDQQVLVHMPEP